MRSKYLMRLLAVAASAAAVLGAFALAADSAPSAAAGTSTRGRTGRRSGSPSPAQDSAVPGQPDDGTAQSLHLAAGEQGGTAPL